VNIHPTYISDGQLLYRIAIEKYVYITPLLNYINM